MAAAAASISQRFGKLSELRRRLLYLLGALVVFRIVAHVPLPGINPESLALMFREQQGTILEVFNVFTGGALQRLSVGTLGLLPYISASIFMQIYSMVDPKLKQLRKEGESGRMKINRYTRYLTVGLAAAQAFFAALTLEGHVVGAGQALVIDPGWGFRLTTVIGLVTGTMFLVWLGEQITERGVGNGISMLIFAGIVAGLPSAAGRTTELVRTGVMNPLTFLFLLVVVLVVTAFVVFVEMGQRRIPVQYAKRQLGRRAYSGQNVHLPFKLNMAGVIPPIFATSLILLPATMVGIGSVQQRPGLVQDIASLLSPGEPLFAIVFAALIVFFCFVYTALVFDSKETAENLKNSGAFVPGMRPGAQTARYLDSVLSRLTVGGAIYITLICLLPEFLRGRFSGIPFYFGGTSLLIIVVVVMDFMSQVQAHLMSHQYEGMLKKADFKRYARRR